jgi:hypothetical protein
MLGVGSKANDLVLKKNTIENFKEVKGGWRIDENLAN